MNADLSNDDVIDSPRPHAARPARVRFAAQGGPPPHPAQNLLLANLISAGIDALLPLLEGVSLPVGLALYEAGEVQRYVHFPTCGIASLTQLLENGDATEYAVTGREGLVGTAFFMGGASSLSSAVVVSAGYAYRIRSGDLKKALEGNSALRLLLLRYTQALITQMAQTAVCNRFHAVDQRLARRLLLSLDRLPSNIVDVTQETLAGMLGVRREGVTEAAGQLQRDGLIRYSRGLITVLDRPGLEARACECYRVVRREYARLMPADPGIPTAPVHWHARPT